MPRQRFSQLCFLFLIVCLGIVACDMPVSGISPAQARFQRYSLEDGLSQSTVWCVLQDQRGFLWVGTNDGLNRFDGYGFTIYRNQARDPFSLANNDVMTLCEDRQGMLWIGTHNGLCRYDREHDRFETFRHSVDDLHSISGNNIRTLYEDHAGRLWIGTFDGGLSRFDPQTRKFERFLQDDPKAEIVDIAEDPSGNLWLGCLEDGIRVFNPATQEITAYRPEPKNPASLSHLKVTTLCADQAGNIWVGTDGGGVCRFDQTTKKFQVYRAKTSDLNSLSVDRIWTVYSDRKGQVWVGTWGGGLCRYLPEKNGFLAYQNHPQNPGSLSSNIVWAIYEDRAGLLWVGTFGGGLCCFDPNLQRFVTFSHDPQNPRSLPSNNVFSFAEDRNRGIWVGTFEGGLSNFDPATGTVTTYRHKDGDPRSLPNDNVWSICPDSQGNLWVATYNGGLSRFDLTSRTFTSFANDPNRPSGLPGNDTRLVFCSRDGTVWVGVRGFGLGRFDPERNECISLAAEIPGLPDFKEARVVYEDQAGTFWLGSEIGLLAIDRARKTFEWFSHKPEDTLSLCSNLVWSVTEAPNGLLWIGTKDGLSCFDRAQRVFYSFRETEGLPNNAVYGILPDGAGNIWISTNVGLSRLTPKQDAGRWTIRVWNFDVGDGLQSNEFNMGASLKTSDGQMLFGGVNGLNLFDPAKIVKSEYLPPVVITGFRKFNQLVKLDSAITEIKDIEINYKDNFISFEFAGLSFSNPGKNQYLFQLEGFNEDWIPAGGQRVATFTNLDGGEYTFRVKASNQDGVWNETGAQIRIRVIPPIWKTKWAYFFYIFGGSGLIYGGVRYRLKRLERQNRELEQKVAERTAALDLANTELAQKVDQLDLANQETERKNQELDQKVIELNRKNEELIASQQRADRIFSALAEALPGTVLEGKYRLEEKIGSGGFGAVFRAIHLALNRTVAVKVFRPSRGNDSAEAVERFRLEGVSASRVNHPNAISVLDSGISTEGIAYLVMELLSGHSLAAELKRSKILSIQRTAQILTPICAALAEAHRIGIVHRDIKPDNIFLHRAPEGEIVKVVDFGIAKLVEDDSSGEYQHLTATGGIVGTPVYMSPERWGNRPYDGRSDVYSLGIMVFQMLTGKLPFVAESNSMVNLVMAHMNKKPPTIREFNPAIPEKIEAVVMQTLEKDPDQRPTAREFAERFEAVLETLIHQQDEATRKLDSGFQQIWGMGHTTAHEFGQRSTAPDVPKIQTSAYSEATLAETQIENSMESPTFVELSGEHQTVDDIRYTGSSGDHPTVVDAQDLVASPGDCETVAEKIELPKPSAKPLFSQGSETVEGPIEAFRPKPAKPPSFDTVEGPVENFRAQPVVPQTLKPGHGIKRDIQSDSSPESPSDFPTIG
ncbi:MAG: protein kinase [Acidobacteria bacterium]|nr:protein kinase [Acidobacteriota bacterium]